MASPQERFLQDHKIEEYVDKKGKTRRRYVYMGDLYIRQLTEKQRRTERYLGVLVALAAGGLAVFAATWNTPFNDSEAMKSTWVRRRWLASKCSSSACLVKEVPS